MLEDLVITYLIGLIVFLCLGCYIFFRYKVEYAIELNMEVNELSIKHVQTVSNRFYKGYLRYTLIWPLYLFVKMVKFTLHLLNE